MYAVENRPSASVLAETVSPVFEVAISTAPSAAGVVSPVRGSVIVYRPDTDTCWWLWSGCSGVTSKSCRSAVRQ
ncbi:hypothetical protein ACRJ4W_50575 [Streptomyces sp. GLT-R25]